MLTCGLKLTHDSAIAIFNDNKLEICIELEKVKNNNRFKIIDSLSDISSILNANGINVSEISHLVIDGWVGLKHATVKAKNFDEEFSLQVAGYHEASLELDVLEKHKSQFPKMMDLLLSGREYESYTHVAGHILSSYLTSPFHQRNESSLILVWDGGMYPRLYFYNVNTHKISNYGPIFYLGVNIYSIFAQHFGPFKINENVIKDELSIAGKVMAYVAYGKVKEEIISDFHKIYELTIDEAKDPSFIPQYPYFFAQKFKALSSKKGYSDEDVLTSFHFFLEQLLLTNLKKYCGYNICISGGSGLNIKWNSSIRKSAIFNEMWVPPFSNDSGSAIGTALCSLFQRGVPQARKIDWCVYSGPKLINNGVQDGWQKKEFDLRQLAKLLLKEPVIFLNGNAELGPRALGNRSILASPINKETKDRLNYIKIREYYRPIAPICLEEHAEKIFDPGVSDIYMLYEHSVRPDWISKIPAVLHEDNTARLQTVGKSNNEVLYGLLQEFYSLTGIPVLCNTSANQKGCGFFPDVNTAMKWGQIPYIWSDGVLYFKKTHDLSDLN